MTIHATPAAEPRPGRAQQDEKGPALELPPAAPLSPPQLAIIKATVPVLQAHGDAITATMYRTLLAAHPALRDMFSATAQATGAQSRALARAVVAYAAHVDDLPRLARAVERIAQKHASLHVRAEQYDVVGEHLLAAIGEVLGDAATPDVVAAWAAAYGLLASVFVAREAQLYAADDGSPGWAAGGWRKFRVARRVPEAEGIVSLHLEPEDGVAPLPGFLPGQYVSLQVFVPRLGHLQSRQYSLSSWDGDAPASYRVSVKREEAGGAEGLVSNLLHGSVGEGDTVELSHPHGEFLLDPSDVSKAGAPVVLVSAGVGATPLVSMLHALARQQTAAVARPVSWVHTSRSRAAQPFAGEVAAVVEGSGHRVTAHVHLRQGEDGGESRPRLDISTLHRERELFVQDPRTEYYICGPEEFMLDVRRKLMELGVEKDRVFLELFATGDVQDE